MAPTVRALVGAEIGGQGVLIADSEVGLIMPDDRVTTDLAFDNLFRTDDILVGWDIDATVNCWANDLPELPRIQLMASVDATWNEYSMLYVPGVFLRVSRWCTNTNRQHRRHKETRTLYDASRFYPSGTPCADVAARWDIPTPGILSAGDAARPFEFQGWTREAIADWAYARCHIVASVVTSIVARLADRGIHLRHYHGVGAVGSELLKMAGADRWIAHYSPKRQPTADDGRELLDIMLRAYYGGRIETTVAGTIAAPLWRLDMRSAYPWALSWLGPVGFKWIHATAFDPRKESRMSVWRVTWNTPSAWIAPFPHREQYGNRPARTTYPQAGEGWYWWPEVRAALTRFGPSEIQVHEGYVSPGSSHRPLLSAMAGWYAVRRELEASDDPLVDVLKGGTNSVWGKLSQRISAYGRPGPYYNPALSGWVSSLVRAQVLASVGPNDMHCAAIMTDGLLVTSEPDAALIRDELGGWRSDRFERAEIIVPGMYRLHRADRSVAVATTGVNRSIDFDWLIDELTHRQQAVVTPRWFVPHVVADLWPDTWERSRCRWVAGRHAINPANLARKRLGAAQLWTGFDWRNGLATLGPYDEVSMGISAAYQGPPAWYGTFDPLYEAARNALADAS